ncbi:MAG: glutathione S-transferase family protein [Lautropia sp.]
MKPTILGRATSANVQKVLWLLEEMGLAAERVDVGGSFGGNREPAYLRRNPTGLVPTLIDGEHAVWESNTILRYLANTRGPTPLYPVDPLQRSQVERWMDWQLGALNGAITPLFWALVRTPPERRDAAAIEQNRAKTAQHLAVLDGVLGERAHVASDAFSLADIAIGAQVYRWYEMPIERPPLANLERWYRSMRTRTGFQTHVMIGLS